MNSLIIKTMQVIVFINFWLFLLFGVAGGIFLAKYLDAGFGVSFSIGVNTYTIASPGSYFLFGFLGLVWMLFFTAPLFAGWTILYSSNQLLRKIEKNTSSFVATTIDRDHMHSNSSRKDNVFLTADPEFR